MSNTLKLTFGYADTDYTRTYSFDVDESVLPGAMKQKIKAINASLAGGSADGLDEFFISEEGDDFKGITNAQLETSETIVLNVAGDD